MKRRIGLQRLVALILSLLLWAFVRYSTPGGVGTQALVQVRLNVRIEVKNNAPDQIPYDISAEEVQITLQGDATATSSLREGLVRAYVDLTGLDAPTEWCEVKALVPGGLKTLSIDPQRVQIKLSEKGSRTVPLRVTVSGSAATGLSVGEVRTEPKSVTVSGPEALLADVQRVTSRVVLDGQSQDYNVELRDLTPVNSQGTQLVSKLNHGLVVFPAVVSATVPILSDNRTVAVAVSLDQLRITPARGWTFRLEVQPEFVTLRLGRNQKPPKFLTTKPQSIVVSTKVDSRELDLVIPNGVEVVGSSTVTLKVVPEKQDLSEGTNSTAPPPDATPAATPSASDKRDG